MKKEGLLTAPSYAKKIEATLKLGFLKLNHHYSMQIFRGGGGGAQLFGGEVEHFGGEASPVLPPLDETLALYVS